MGQGAACAQDKSMLNEILGIFGYIYIRLVVGIHFFKNQKPNFLRHISLTSAN